MRTTTEMQIRMAEYDRRVAPVRARINQTVGDLLVAFMARAIKRRRKSKGWRRHVRRMKANTR